MSSRALRRPKRSLPRAGLLWCVMALQLAACGETSAPAADTAASDAMATFQLRPDAEEPDTAAEPPGVVAPDPSLRQGACKPLNPQGFGPCKALLGVVFDGAGCVFVSGCGCEGDCEHFFADPPACEAACADQLR